jgi:hypothetical protein
MSLFERLAGTTLASFAISISSANATLTTSPATALTDVPTASLTITSQAPFSGAVTNITPGNIILNTPAPISGTNYGLTYFQSGGVSAAAIGKATGAATYGAIYLNGTGVTPTASNYILRGDTTDGSVDLNSPGVSTLTFRVNNVVQQSMVSGSLTLTPPLVEWGSAVVAPTLTQITPTTDVATQPLLIQSQAPFSGAVTNLKPGNIALNVPAPIGAGAFGVVQVQQGGTTVLQFGNLVGQTIGTYYADYPGSVTPSATNFTRWVAVSAGTQTFNATTQLNFAIGGTNVFSTISTSLLMNVNNLTWNNGFTPSIGETSTSSQTQGNSITITPQQSTQATNNGGGNLVVALQTPAGTGTEAYLKTQRGANITTALGAFPGSFSGALWLGQTAATTPTNLNWTLFADGTNAYISAPSSGGIHFYVNNTTFLASWNATTLGMGLPLGGIPATNALSYSPVTVALTSGATNTLTPTQYANPVLKFTGTLAGAGTTVVLPAVDGAIWYLDFSAVTFGTFSIAIIINGVTWSGAANITTAAATQFPIIRYTAGAARPVGVFQTE